MFPPMMTIRHPVAKHFFVTIQLRAMNADCGAAIGDIGNFS
jgi:hypothetical protein